MTNLQQIDTTTPEGFKQARRLLDLSVPDMARILNTGERSIQRWENHSERDVHPTAALVIDMLLNGFRPDSWPSSMTGSEMNDARIKLGLTVGELAEFLDVEDELVDLWCSDERGPSPVVRQVMIWLTTDESALAFASPPTAY